MSDNLPALRGLNEDQFLAEANKAEGFTQEESIIPFVKLLQPLSPQVNSLPEAQAGKFMNVATNTIYDSLNVLPIFHVWNFTEWTSRDAGGGFIRNWGEDIAGWQEKCEDDQRNAYMPITKDGTIISKQRHFYCFAMNDDGTYERAIMPFAATSLKVARQWSSLLQNPPKVETSKGLVAPAFFYYVYTIDKTSQQNTKGRWYLPTVKFSGKRIVDYPNGNELWLAAIGFRDSFKAGEIQAASQIESDNNNDF